MSAANVRAASGEIDRTLAALADPHRRRVVDLLSQGPRAAGDLARELALTPPAMSRHLRTLRHSGLVEESHPTFDARVRIYALRPEPMANLLRWLEEAERLWSEQLMAFKAHLERGPRPEPDPATGAGRMTSKVYVALRVKASPERAFQAFVEEIGAWWRPSPLFETTPRPGRLSFELPREGGGEGGRLIETREGGKVFEIGKIRVWEPPQRLVFSWRQANFPLDLHTEVEVGFEAVGEETRVSVEHRGFDQAPLDSAARHGFPDQILLMRLADFWRGQIAELGERLE